MGLSTSLHRIHFVLSALALAFVCPFTEASAKEPSPPLAPVIPESEIITLPKYDVTTERVLPPIEQWHYVSIPGFEILSNASERNTTLFVQDFYLLRQVAQIILPTIKETNPVPTYIVLCGQGNAFETFVPDGSTQRRASNGMFLSDSERSAIVIDFTFQDRFGEIHDLAGIRGGNDPFHAFYLQYFRELVHNNIKPSPPTWLEEGLVQLLAATDYSTRKITIGKVGGETTASSRGSYGGGWNNHGVSLGNQSNSFHNPGGSYSGNFNTGLPNVSTFESSFPEQSSSKPGSFNSILAHRPIMPLATFFAYDQRQRGNARPENYSAHAYLFTHLCLYGRGQRYTKAFFKLSQRAGNEPITDSVFKECFGIPFKEMEKEMRAYITFTDYKAIERRAKKGYELTTAPDFKLRDATDAESSRIAGEVLRLAGHRAAARSRLIAPYVRGQYDADLLAALGLTELQYSNKERARRFLEAAAKGNTTRTKAYVELARLRYDEIQTKTATENRAATADEFTWLQAPLYQGLTHPPALADLYDFLARTWYFSPNDPTKEQFETLAAGAQQNYTNLGLVYRVAALGLKYNHIETSRRFVAFGLANSPDPDTKGKFELLAKELPPEKKPITKN
jgi:hypothetical protein